MLLNLFRRRETPFTLVIGMTGVKMGDRLVQVGCGNAAQLAAVAAKVGLSGRAVAIVPDTATGGKVDKAAARAGALIEVIVSSLTQLPVEDEGFDVAVIDDTATAFTRMSEADRRATVRETTRVLRPGGRIMVLGAVPRTGLAGKWSGGSDARSADPTPALQGDGYRAVRVLAERDGLIFYEGMKPRA